MLLHLLKKLKKKLKNLLNNSASVFYDIKKSPNDGDFFYFVLSNISLVLSILINYCLLLVNRV